ncbi:DUF5753 domain-containing protein [Lentzea sp. NPDC051213]|uniref:DUF5753 domain-containing protein n=1 Tax=Lentzea sp. NPDC051213 TaxID=3364126 RepID=UPI0037946714
MRHVQHRIAQEEAGVRSFRVFQTMIIPGLVQTPEYAKVCLSHSEPLFGPRKDVDEAVRIRMQRQDVLHQPDRRFHFVITEAALRFRLCEPDVMLSQLRHLNSLSALPTVKLGVIGFDAVYGAAFPKHGFSLLDEDHVNVETFSAELTITQPQEIELYGKIFDSLAGIASYGDEAHRIINRAIDDLSTEVDEDPPTG